MCYELNLPGTRIGDAMPQKLFFHIHFDFIDQGFQSRVFLEEEVYWGSSKRTPISPIRGADLNQRIRLPFGILNGNKVEVVSELIGIRRYSEGGAGDRSGQRLFPILSLIQAIVV